MHGNNGNKNDHGKLRIGLVLYQFADALKGVAKVLTFGAMKYPCKETSDRSWKAVPSGIERYSDAFGRHYMSLAREIEDCITNPKGWRVTAIDAETGQLEIDHCITNLLFLRRYMYGEETDFKIIPPDNQLKTRPEAP